MPRYLTPPTVDATHSFASSDDAGALVALINAAGPPSGKPWIAGTPVAQVHEGSIFVTTLSGIVQASVGDVIVQTDTGEFRPYTAAEYAAL